MIKLVRSEKPKTCEMFVKDKVTGMLRRCPHKIAFISGSSGGFVCISCTNMLHKRYPNYKKYRNAKPYLKKWFNTKGKDMKEWKILYKKDEGNEYKAVNIKAKTLDKAINICATKYGKPCTKGVRGPKQIG